MSNRSRPRAMTVSSTANGNTSASFPFTLPVYRSESSCSCPRATVPGTSGRADRSSEKNVDSRSGMYFGWSCISCRHAAVNNSVHGAATKNTKTRNTRKPFCTNGPFAAFVLSWVSRRLVRNGRDLTRIQRFKKLARAFDVELRIDRLDADEKAIAARERESRHVEDRVIRLRQPVERQHAEYRRERRRENRALERHRDERRPAVERPSANVDRIRHRRNPVLHRVAADAADQAAD